MITTVGDQIFSLKQEIKQLKKRCQRYETALRHIAAEGGNHHHNGHKCSSFAKQALADMHPSAVTASQ